MWPYALFQRNCILVVNVINWIAKPHGVILFIQFLFSVHKHFYEVNVARSIFFARNEVEFFIFVRTKEMDNLFAE